MQSKKAGFYIPKATSLWIIMSALIFVLGQSCAIKSTLEATDESNQRDQIVSAAEGYLGSKYVYGGNGTKGFDCSGLVSKVFYENKIDIRGNSESLAKQGIKRKTEEARKGDLIFFMKGNKVNHVALITKNKGSELWVIHSTSSKGVIRENIFASSYWKNKKYFIKDLL